MSAVVKPLIFAIVCFFAGYQFAVFTKLPTSSSEQKLQSSSPENSLDPTDAYDAQNTVNTDNVNYSKDESLIALEGNSKPATLHAPPVTDLSDGLANDDIDAMLASLEDLKAGRGNAQLIAIQYDLLKKSLIENPENLDYMVAQLDSYSVNSDSFDTILSAIRMSPSKDTDLALFSLAEQYGGLFDHDSQDKFLAILSSTSTPIESEQIVRSLADLAMLEEVDAGTKLSALSLMKPYQFRTSEKADIGRELNHLVNNTGDQEAARFLPHLMRFSEKQKRIELASNLLSQNRSTAVRNAVLESISSGLVPATNDMKVKLFEMANDSDDPLSAEASEILGYSFELSRQEYSQLTAYQ